MIVSASRRTDIPAFWGDWFINRIEEGFFISKNPFNPAQVRRVSLRPEDVEVIVFWTKNPRPFLKILKDLDSRGYRYYFQYTLNDYSQLFEPFLPPATEKIDSFLRLCDQIGTGKVVWRYDPIIISSETPAEYHLEKLSIIAGRLKGAAERLTVSFMDLYGRVEKRLQKLEKSKGIIFTDLTQPEKKEELLHFSRELKRIADNNGMEVFTCTEPVELQEVGIAHGSCIDGKLIKKLFNLEKEPGRDRNQRKGCLCAAAVDMGGYNTCGYRCLYCYANHGEKPAMLAES